MQNIIAVCDHETEYAHKLMEFMNGKKAFMMKAAAFTDEERMREYSNSNKVDIMLLSENMVNETTISLRAGKKVMLKESKNKNAHPEIGNVYKYQSAEKILREVMSLYDAENLFLNEDTKWRERKQIIGIYTPAGGTRKTSFALTLGQILAKQSSVLYMNLEGFSGLETMLGMSFEHDLGELLYYAGHTGSNPVLKLPSLTVTLQNMDIIPPVQSPDDLKSIKTSKWIELFSGIMTGTDYDVLVLDLGNEINDLGYILDFCTSVYMPVREDPPAKAKIKDFYDYIKAAGVDTGKIKTLKLPFNTASKAGRDYYENLAWSELGDYTRQLLSKAR